MFFLFIYSPLEGGGGVGKKKETVIAKSQHSAALAQVCYICLGVANLVKDPFTVNLNPICYPQPNTHSTNIFWINKALYS